MIEIGAARHRTQNATEAVSKLINFVISIRLAIDFIGNKIVFEEVMAGPL